jgi:hypothetical protein
MKKRVVISEEQYKRVFLSEQPVTWQVPDGNSLLNWKSTSNIEDLTRNGVVTTEQKTIAKLYRLWANSTDELSKKYGKKSIYDLDEKSNNPYGGTFLKSYKVGKSKFDTTWLASSDGSDFINLSKGGKYQYSYDYKRKEWWFNTSMDGTTLSNQVDPKEKMNYNGVEEIKKLKSIYTNSVKSKDVNKTISNVDSSLKKEKELLDKSKASSDANIENVRTFLKGLGFDMVTPGGFPDIMPKNPLSGNHLMAQSALNATRYLTSGLISDKVISSVKGNVEVCVTSVGSTCAPPLFYTAKYFDYEMGKVVSSKTIGKYPAQFVVYLSNFYFDFGKLQKDLDDAFKSDKDAYKSNLFPDGWWGWFNAYWGTDNLNTITQNIRSISSNDIPNNIETVNKYKTGGSIWSYLGDCFSDYHCALDIASIAALAIPGVGPIVSMGLDFVNAGAYGVEAATADTSEEREAAILAGGLTLFGGLLGGGVGQTKRLLSAAEKNPKIYSYANEVINRTEKELPSYKNFKSAEKDAKLTTIYKETADKYGLSNSDVLVGHDIIKDFSRIDIGVANKYTEALSKIDSKLGRANLRRIGNDSRFKNLVLSNNGDVVTSLNKFIKTQAGKEALVELGLFVTLSEVLAEPEVALWLNQSINIIKHSVSPTVKTTIQKDGYEFKATKEIFLSDGSLKDNTLLFDAYNNGWRPWPKDIKTPSQEDVEKSREWLIKNPKYQTDTFKEWVKSQVEDLSNKSLSGKEVSNVELTPVDPKQKKENVRYVDNKEEMDALTTEDGKDGRNEINLLLKQEQEFLKKQK